MNEPLLSYYENELRFIREMGKEFAKEYPGIAARLMLGEGESKDPHVERLIEAFAFIAGRIRHKIDDEFPEITESLLEVLYPHYIRPVPSMAIAQFELDPAQTGRNADYKIPKDSSVYTRPIKDLGVPCKFRTCYPVTLWPLEVKSASILLPGRFPPGLGVEHALAAVRIAIRCVAGAKLPALGLRNLRFCLNGDPSFVYTLYELLLNNVFRAALFDGTDSKKRALFPPGCIRPVGFDAEEGMLPYSTRSFVGYRLLQEYFSFPHKFLFFEIDGFEGLELNGFGDTFEIVLFLNDFERRERLHGVAESIGPDTFQLGCSPIVNLFEKTAEPIRLTHMDTEYHLVPDVYLPNATEVYSVDRVSSLAASAVHVREYKPFYSLQHVYEEGAPRAYWHAMRRPSMGHSDYGTEVYMSFVNLEFKPAMPADETVTVSVTCTNRDIPPKLEITHKYGELWMQSQPLVGCRFLTRPTKPQRPPLQHGLQWRLISHLALNHISLGGQADDRDRRGVEPLREVLRLYDYSGDSKFRNQIEGIVSLATRPHLAPISSPQGVVFALGSQIEIEFDEDRFVGSGVFLMASVLERFLSLYSALNSFSQLVAKTTQRKGVLREWEPRAGEQIVL